MATIVLVPPVVPPMTPVITPMRPVLLPVLPPISLPMLPPISLAMTTVPATVIVVIVIAPLAGGLGRRGLLG
ncbi:MAG: hypothetical protein AAGI71_19075 [Bacteroidota bacterium]